ncbi:MAG: M20 family peptidase, partial [Cyclobacteriaceae bacterium]|nr:M20 family peptidase [Cyclobacteriaceae bacterium]
PPSPEAIAHFQQAISYKTISYGDSTLFDSTAFIGFREFLQKSYPLLHATLSREIVADYSLLYTWKGKNPELKPIVLMAHQDVVPIEEATQTMWTVNPFEGVVKDNYIWGRGTTDDKINLVSIFEAIEKLLKENFQPDRTVYLAFGHNEEIGGTGAKAIANLLVSRKVSAEMVMDEGGIITKEKIPGMDKPVGLIGTSEKGYLSVELTVEKSGGHSSQPEPETSIDILANAILKIRNNPFDASFSESTQGFLDHVGPEMPFVQKMVFANQWLFKSVIMSTYSKSGAGNAMLRTTAVPTIIDAGIKDNVIPTVAKATVNQRLLPGDASTDVIEQLKKIVADERITIKPANSFLAEASAVTPVNSFGYQTLSKTIRKTAPNTVTAPFMLMGGTDSRHFAGVSSSIVKFSPMIDPIGFHGIDERVSLESYGLAIWFYEQLLRDTK